MACHATTLQTLSTPEVSHDVLHLAAPPGRPGRLPAADHDDCVCPAGLGSCKSHVLHRAIPPARGESTNAAVQGSLREAAQYATEGWSPSSASNDPFKSKPSSGWIGAFNWTPSLGWKPRQPKLAGDENTSRLHLLVHASKPGTNLCYNLVSTAVNRFPVPTLLGYGGTGEFDAGASPLARIRSLERYLYSLSVAEDDDLVLVVSGDSVLAQLPADVTTARYFEMRERADAHLARRLGMGAARARSGGLRQTIFMGPDKVCFPLGHHEPRCWAAPASGLARDAFGPATGNGEARFADPRWLNAGTIMGPAGDLREYVAEALRDMEMTGGGGGGQGDGEGEGEGAGDSDQLYFADVWGRQEYYRTLRAQHGAKAVETREGQKLPRLRTENQKTEFHVAIDYESALFQTNAGYTSWSGYASFGGRNLTAKMDGRLPKLGGKTSSPSTSMMMPENVAASLTRIFDSIPKAHPHTSAAKWIRQARLGINFVTRQIYGLWHCTDDSDPLSAEYKKLWFYPYAHSLLRASVRAARRHEPISAEPIDGRRWVPRNAPPTSWVRTGDPLGGAWSDAGDGAWVPWKDLCGGDHDALFAGERA